MNKLMLLSISLSLVFLISACSPTIVQTTSQAEPEENSTEVSIYPGPQSVVTNDQSYPAPETPSYSTPVPTPTYDKNMGNIRGKLLRNKMPVPSITLYLAEVMKDEAGNDLIAGLDIVNSSNTTTQDQGDFAFINIKPGRYALILDVITNQFLLHYPGTEDPIILQVEANIDIDIGELDFDDLPMP